jgi:hypothetical protein
MQTSRPNAYDGGARQLAPVETVGRKRPLTGGVYSSPDGRSC